jgi:hypothetical protein
MNLRRSFQRNNEGIGTVFGMVFFLLIVMVVFASFVIILSQNTSLEQTTITAKQMDLDRYTELTTVSITNPQVAVSFGVVYISCTITNTGTLPTELVRLWIKDNTTNTVGNTTIAPSIILQPGSSIQYFNFTRIANAGLLDQFSFWFISTRGNAISAFPNTNQLNGIILGTFPGVTSMNSTYQTNQYNPLQLSLNTTKSNQLIYVVVSFDDGNTLYTPTSTPTLTWNARGTTLPTDGSKSTPTSGHNGDSILKTFYAIKPSIGPITINIQSTADELSDYYCSALAFTINDVNTTSPFDGSAQTTIGSSVMPQDTINTQFSNELIIGALGIDDLNPPITPAAGFGQIMPVQSSYGATGADNSKPRSVWSEWNIMGNPTNNLPVNCTFPYTEDWAIIVDAVKLVVVPPTAPVSLSPNSGPSGQLITVSGQGFAANSQLIATFDGLQVPFSVTTDGSGNIPSGVTLTVPQGSTSGIKTVSIIDSKFNYASANFTVTPSNITISPQIGPVGTSVVVTGSNFVSNSNITLNFDGNSMTTNPSTVTANATGYFSATFSTTSDSVGVKQVWATDGFNYPSANFTVTPSITLNPTNGPIGSTVNVTGFGFATFNPVTITFGGSTVLTIPANNTTDNFGFFNVSFIIPTGQTSGGKTVNVADASLNSAISTFTVTPSISLNPTSGNAGSTVTVSGSGFAASKQITATYAGSSITLSGITNTNSTGSFFGATFTVPTSTAGGTQSVVIRDASSNSANANYMVNTLTQKITVALSNSAPATQVIINGGYPQPNTLAADGTQYSIQMVAGASFNLSFVNSGNTRDGFNLTNAFSTSSSLYTASINSISVTAYEQVQNSFSTPFTGGNPGSLDSISLIGTNLGSGLSTIATLNSTNSWSASAWNDYGTTVTFPTSSILSGSNERWAISSTYLTISLTTGGNPYSKTYYNQYSFQLDYVVSGNGAPTAPTLTATQFGSSYTPTLGTSLVTYWLDGGQSWSVTNPLGGSGSNERWNSRSTVSGIVSSSSPVTAGTGTLTFTYYHQYLLTVAGGNGVTYGTVSPSGDNWYDNGMSTTVSSNGVYSRASGTGLRVSSWRIDSGTVNNVATTGTVLTSSVSMSAAHAINFVSNTQYQVTLDTISTSALNSITSPTVSSDNYWYDSGTSVNVLLNGVWGISGGTGTRLTGYAINGGSNTPTSTTGTVTVFSGVISNHEFVTATSVTQYQVTFSQTGVDSSAGSNTVLAVGSTNYAYSALPNSVWFDSGTTYTWSSTVSAGSGKQFALTSSPVASSISAAGTYLATYKTQYQCTFTRGNVGSDVVGTVLTVGSNTYTYAQLPQTNIWVDANTAYSYTNTVSASASKQYVLTGIAGLSTPVIATGTATPTYKTQYFQTVTSTPAMGSGYVSVDSVAQVTPYQAWWDSGSSHTIAAISPVTIISGQSQYVYSSWSDSGAQSHSVSPTAVSTYTISFQLQYYFSVSSVRDTPTGQGWYNAGSSVSSTVTRPVSGGTGIQYESTGWTGTGSLSSGGSAGSSSTGSFTISAYSTCTWNWKTQYQVTFSQTGVDSSAGSNTVLAVGSTNYAYSALPNSVWFDSGTTFSWASPVSGGTGKQFVITGSSGSSPIVASGTYSATYKTVAIAKIGTDTSASGTALTLSWSHTLVTGANRLVVVCLGTEHTGITVSGVTYGGKAMTLAVSTQTLSTGSYMLNQIWYILEANLPSNGANNVIVTATANGGGMTDISGFCSEYTGVKQSAPEATNGVSQLSGNTITNTISPTTNSWVISTAGSGNVGTWTPGAPQVEMLDYIGSSSCYSVSELRGASGQTSLASTYSGTVNRLVRVCASFQAAP